MKKISCLLLAFIIAFIFVACGTDNQTLSGSEDESIVSEEPALPVPPTINGGALADYRIIYRETNDPARYLYAARELRDYIQGAYGIELRVFSEAVSLPESDKEIIVGLCDSRPICEDYFYEIYRERGDYITLVSDKTVLFASNYGNGAHFAVKDFCDYLAEKNGGDVKDMKKNGTGKVLKVACVGDSITQGINSSDPNKTYPNYLQEMLGLDYYVVNFGLSGYSTCRSDEYAYRKSTTYRSSLEFEPDIVIYALGTNDCNPGQDYKSWEGTDREELFIGSTHELIDSYLSLPTKPQIYICLPCSLFKVGADGWNAEAWTALNEKYSVPLLKKIAQDYGFEAIDLWTWSKSNKAVFTDGLHPKDGTYKLFASAIYDAIKDTVRKPQ